MPSCGRQYHSLAVTNGHPWPYGLLRRRSDPSIKSIWTYPRRRLTQLSLLFRPKSIYIRFPICSKLGNVPPATTRGTWLRGFEELCGPFEEV
jgi:hypothetical protein